MKKWWKKIAKFNAAALCLGIILGMTSFSPTVKAKASYKTMAYDKKLEKAADFEQGEFKNVRLDKKGEGVELEVEVDGLGEYVSPVVHAPFGATHVGLHWNEEKNGGEPLKTYLRNSQDGQNFGAWQETAVEVEEGRDDRPSEEVFAAIIGVDGAAFAQAKVEFPSDRVKSSKLNDLTLTFINSGEESKQVSHQLTFSSFGQAAGIGILKTSPNGQNINVISREEWGADENLRLKTDGSEEWPRSYHGTRKLIVHHTAVASSNGVINLEDNKAAVRAIYYYHAITQGWGDIGYNALVDAAGNIYEGRYGTHGSSPTRPDPTPDQVMELDVEAGHASGYNMGSFGVSAMGDFTKFNIPAAQLAAVKDVLAYVADSRGIDADGSSDFRRYDGSWHLGMGNLIGHRDATATACPGNKFYPLMGSIRSEVDSRMQTGLEGFSATAQGVSISGKSIGSYVVDFTWQPFTGSSQYQYTLERVYGTPGVASDSQPWETAWLLPENQNTASIGSNVVSIDTSTLTDRSNYVFYVRALDAEGNSLSSTSQVNFFVDHSVVLDIEAPVVEITSPVSGATVSGIVTVKASASDNVAVTKMELYIDGTQVASVVGSSISYSWNTKKIKTGLHILTAKAYDAAGNSAAATNQVYR